MLAAGMPIDFRTLFVGGMVLNWAWEQYLRVRKGWALQNNTIPAALKAHIDAKTFDKTRRYNATKNRCPPAPPLSSFVSILSRVVCAGLGMLMTPLAWRCNSACCCCHRSSGRRRTPHWSTALGSVATTPTSSTSKRFCS